MISDLNFLDLKIFEKIKLFLIIGGKRISNKYKIFPVISLLNLWPEAESNCRPLVFQIWVNLLTSLKYNLFDLIIRSLLTGSRE